MNRQEINQHLQENHKEFSDFILSLPDDKFLFSKNEKWTAGQQLDHICRSVKPLAQGLQLPKFIIGLIFGKTNRPSKTYDELVKKYLSKLADGGKASGRFIPKTVSVNQKVVLTKNLSRSINRLIKNMESFSEEDLDLLIVPHPLLGKLTVREMMYFTIYHVQHHLEIIKRDLTV